MHSAVTDLTVGLGRKFKLSLKETRPNARIRWTTENDPVLDLRESTDRLQARVKATELGVGVIYVNAVGEDPIRLTVRVIPMDDTANQAVTLGGSIGEEVPDA